MRVRNRNSSRLLQLAVLLLFPASQAGSPSVLENLTILNTLSGFKPLYLGSGKDHEYFISEKPATAEEAQRACRNISSKFNLISLESKDELEKLVPYLRSQDIPKVWSSGVKYSVSNVSKYVWTQPAPPKPVTFLNFPKLDRLRIKQEELLPDLGPRCRNGVLTPRCKPGNCNVTLPDCAVEVPHCTLSVTPPCNVERPDCGATCDNNCTVVQPVCTVYPQPCDVVTPPCKVPTPECTIRKGTCTVYRPPCQAYNPPCEPPTTPAPCTTTAPPCATTQQACTTERPPCKDGKCPPPVTKCKKMFKCEPIVCQSPPLICPGPVIICPPEKLVCTPPELVCSKPQIECPEPQVTCPPPKVHCTKPEVKCDSPEVNCPGTVVQCPHPQYNCPSPVVHCPPPIVDCEKPEECPNPTEPPTPCPQLNGDEGGNGVGDGDDAVVIVPPEECDNCLDMGCIALRKESDFKWKVQSCTDKLHFVCEG